MAIHSPNPPSKHPSVSSPKPLPPLPATSPSSSKPLPPVPPVLPKALPPLPPIPQAKPNYKTTLLIVAGLFLWFLAIVVLLPVIMEREAMIGLNKALRKMVVGEKDEL